MFIIEVSGGDYLTYLRIRFRSHKDRIHARVRSRTLIDGQIDRRIEAKEKEKKKKRNEVLTTTLAVDVNLKALDQNTVNIQTSQ